jgi:tetratricopeptide repeat protein
VAGVYLVLRPGRFTLGLARLVRRYLARVVLAGALACVLSETATAQDLQNTAENPEADKFVERGIQLRAEGKDAEALKAFEKAAEIDPESVRIQLHLATVHQALGDWLAADQYLSLALRRQNHPYVNRHRKALEDAQRVISANIGSLEVDGEPAGAEVRLNGRLVGTLPLSEPVRVVIGSYLLEVRLDRHYTAQRPIVITGGGLVRESFRLEPMPADDRGAPGASTPAGAAASVTKINDEHPVRPGLTWTLAGASAVAGTTTVVAVILREVHAGRWNDNARCLRADQTREQVCGSEREAAETAGTVALAGGVLTGLFAAGALVNAFAFAPPEAPPQVGLAGCTLVGLTGASCFGSF